MSPSFLIIYLVYFIINPAYSLEIYNDKSSSNEFSQNYEKARNIFKENSIKFKLNYQEINVGGHNEPNLYFQTGMSPNKKDCLAILLSGLHGSEAYLGSAIINKFMVQSLGNHLEKIQFLFIHNFNPYGMKYFRRTTKNNVDLNRNFFNNPNELQNQNYLKINHILNPVADIHAHPIYILKDLIQWGYLKFKMGIELKKTILKGQNINPKGLFYSGIKEESQTLWLKNKIIDLSNKYKKIIMIDLHSGYGEYKKLHYFSPNSKLVQNNVLFKKIFNNLKLDNPESQDFYETNGDLASYFLENTKNIESAFMTFEFGTLNTQTFIGSLRSLRYMILENQLHNYGDQNKKTDKEIKANFETLFHPNDKLWRSSVLNQGVVGLEKTILDLESIKK